MNKKEKKALSRAWKESEKEEYILSSEQAELLFTFLEESLDEKGCDHTRRFTELWLNDHCSDNKEQVLEEMRRAGGYCDCEVLMNCYEEYE